PARPRLHYRDPSSRDMMLNHRFNIAADYRTARRPARDLSFPATSVPGEVSWPPPLAAKGAGRVNSPVVRRALGAGARDCGSHMNFGESRNRDLGLKPEGTGTTDLPLRAGGLATLGAPQFLPTRARSVNQISGVER